MSDQTKWNKMGFSLTIDSNGPMRDSFILINLNECWSYWLSKMYPDIDPSAAIKNIVIKKLEEFANTQTDLNDNAHKDFLKKVDW